jgi:hypothetical protein
VDHLLGDKAFVTIYFSLIKYHRGDVIEVMSGKPSFLKKLLKNKKNKYGCFASWITSSHY